MKIGKYMGAGAVLSLALLVGKAAFAADTPVADSGDTAWMLTSSLLVLMMSVPGLALALVGCSRALAA